MDRSVTAVGCVLLGLLLVGGAVTLGSPGADRVILVEDRSEQMNVQGQPDVAYGDLPPSAQAAVDEARRSGHTTLRTYGDYEAVEALTGVSTVRMAEQVVSLRVQSADGGGPFGGLLHDVALAFGGVLLAATLVVSAGSERSVELALLPIGGTLVVLGVNGVLAPDSSLVPWIGLAALGVAAAVPVLASYALRQRDRLAGTIAVVTAATSVGILLAGDGASALYFLAPVIGLGVPGLGLGVLLADGHGGRELSSSKPAPSP